MASNKGKSLSWMHNYEIVFEALKDLTSETMKEVPVSRRPTHLFIWVNDELVERIANDYGRNLSKKQVHVAIHNLLRHGKISLVKRGKYQIEV